MLQIPAPLPRHLARAAAALSLALLPACGGRESTGSAGEPGGAAAAIRVTAKDRSEAQALFDSLCWTCHGKTGHGDGPASAGLDPKPRSFADQAWQAAVDDEHIRKVITLGGAAVGKSANMPPQPQLKSQPGMVQALVEIVRSQGR
jgi:mono/diheme cytochrome c family protein